MSEKLQSAEDYARDWNSRLKRAKAARREGISVVLFCIAGNWFALPTQVFRELADPRPVHKVPHRSNESFLGLVNVRGTLHLFVSLKNLLQLETLKTAFAGSAYARFVVLQHGSETWAFQADEIASLNRINKDEIIPVRDSKKASSGIIEWHGKTVDLLEEDLLFEKLRRCLE